MGVPHFSFICMECSKRQPLGPVLPFHALCGECHSFDLCLYLWLLPALLPPYEEDNACFYAFCGIGTHGIDKLHLTIICGYDAVLWPWNGVGHIDRPCHYRVRRHRCFPFVHVAQQVVAPPLPVRTSRMDLAHPDLRPLFQDFKVIFAAASRWW